MVTNYTLREQIILKLLDKTLEYSDVYDISDVRIARIHHIADKLAAPPDNNNIPDTDIPLDTPIEAIGIPTIGLNSLRHRDINTIADLVNFSRSEILKMRGMGKLGITQIDQFFEEHNLKFVDQL